ncbi:MAG: hypothetical protein JWQ28_2128 [Pedobacter sp.]|jgi:hypothetical protein|nr:hypothetical protein [Pedobacter sp.]
MALTEVGLAKELDKHGYELLSFSRKGKDMLEVYANCLHTVDLEENEKVFIPVPVTLDLQLDDHDKVKAVNSRDSDAEMLKHASSFVRTLVDNGQIFGLNGQNAPNTSHKIETNEKGQRIIKRKGFSIL